MRPVPVTSHTAGRMTSAPRLARGALLAALVLALTALPARAETDFTKLGPWGFTFVGFEPLPGPGQDLIGSVDDRVAPYVSSDGGRSWRLSTDPPRTTIYAYLGSRAHPGTVWLGSAGGDVYVSHDGGLTTTYLGKIPGRPQIYQLGRRGSTFVAFTPSGLARSTDLRAWTITPLSVEYSQGVVTDDGEFAGVAVDATLHGSADGGATMTSVSLGTPDPQCAPFSVAVAGPALARIYAADRCGHIWRSTDGGTSFDALAAAPMAITSMAVDTGSADVVYVTTRSGGFRSSDAGVTWTPLPAAPAAATLVPDPDRAGVVYGSARWGLVRTSDAGLSWQSVGPRITGYDFVRSVARTSGALLVGSKAGVLALRNGESTWRSTSGLPGDTNEVSIVRVDPHRPSVALAVTSDGTGYHLYRSDDSGATWAAVDAAGSHVNDVAFDSAAPGVIWVATNLGLVHTSDDGVTWASTPLAADHVAVVAGSPQHLLLGRSTGIWRSTDGGVTAARVIAPPGPADRMWGSMVSADPYHPGGVLAQVGNDLRRSSDGGATWHPVDTALSSRFPPVYSRDGVTIFATGEVDAVIASIDGGATWSTTPDHTDPHGVLRAPSGIALLPGAPLTAASRAALRQRPPIVYAARRTVTRAVFRGRIPNVELAPAGVSKATRSLVRVHVVCWEPFAAYCGSSVTIRQNGRVVGRAVFNVPSTDTIRRRRRGVTIRLRGAHGGPAVLELRNTSPWASRLRTRVSVVLR
jgi:photosystem II stability/assembly factor-like uncharacterized protein